MFSEKMGGGGGTTCTYVGLVMLILLKTDIQTNKQVDIHYQYTGINTVLLKIL